MPFGTGTIIHLSFFDSEALAPRADRILSGSVTPAHENGVTRAATSFVIVILAFVLVFVFAHGAGLSFGLVPIFLLVPVNGR